MTAETVVADADPILPEARAVAARACRRAGAPSLARAISNGQLDNDLYVRVAVAAMLRGIEMGKRDEP